MKYVVLYVDSEYDQREERKDFDSKEDALEFINKEKSENEFFNVYGFLKVLEEYTLVPVEKVTKFKIKGE